MNLFEVKNATNQPYASFNNDDLILDIKREDLLHKEVSGNKLRKLKYNLIEAQSQGKELLITFGGAFSNHIAATAAAGKIAGFETLGIIRGEELGVDLGQTLASNDTLATASSSGMELKFVSRTAYRVKNEASYLAQLKATYPHAYIIPEGGTNKLAVKGTEEILTATDKELYDIITVAAGTGGTAAGIINSAGKNQHVVVFSALKGDFMRNEILKYTTRTDFEVIDETAFGGYAKSSEALIDFMNASFRESRIPLDPIYTAKMMYGVEQMIESGVITGKSRILAVHTGGLQSIAGFNRKLLKKGQRTIDYV
ncbi:MAG: pyridoxal-phosphate dependent enzyme [Nonlabens sp.]|nr:pyridoxal-phosphate dependent enzyme [Nonlabens sp.]